MLVKVTIPNASRLLHPSNPNIDAREAAIDILNRAETVKVLGEDRTVLLGNDAYVAHLTSAPHAVDEFPTLFKVATA